MVYLDKDDKKMNWIKKGLRFSYLSNNWDMAELNLFVFVLETKPVAHSALKLNKTDTF